MLFGSCLPEEGNMKIEPAQYEDLPEIAALQKLAFYQVAAFYGNFRIRPLLTTLEEFEQGFAAYRYLKIVLDGRIVGSARGKMQGETCKIENVIVHPAYQQRGIGKALVLELMSQSAGASRFELFTGKETPGNVAFYERMGFSVYDEIPATGFEPILVLMEKLR